MGGEAWNEYPSHKCCMNTNSFIKFVQGLSLSCKVAPYCLKNIGFFLKIHGLVLALLVIYFLLKNALKYSSFVLCVSVLTEGSGIEYCVSQE